MNNIIIQRIYAKFKEYFCNVLDVNASHGNPCIVAKAKEHSNIIKRKQAIINIYIERQNRSTTQKFTNNQYTLK